MLIVEIGFFFLQEIKSAKKKGFGRRLFAGSRALRPIMDMPEFVKLFNGLLKPGHNILILMSNKKEKKTFDKVYTIPEIFNYSVLYVFNNRNR